MTARMVFTMVEIENYVGNGCRLGQHHACPGGWPVGANTDRPSGTNGTPCACTCHDEVAPGYESCPTFLGCSVFVGDDSVPEDRRAAAMAAHVSAAHKGLVVNGTAYVNEDCALCGTAVTKGAGGTIYLPSGLMAHDTCLGYAADSIERLRTPSHGRVDA